jgi:signal transduction histidine kinase
MDYHRFFELVNDPAMPYVVQAILGLTMYFIFRHFSRIYVRRFLRTWSRAWLAFAVNMLATVVIMAHPGDEQWPYAMDLLLHFVAQLGSFLHITFILIGSYQLVFSKPFNRKLNYSLVSILSVLALVAAVAFSQDPAKEELRYMLRIGSRCFVSGFGFLVAGIVVWMNPKFTKGLGQKILSSSFLVFSAYQLFVLFTVVFDVHGEQNLQPGARGLVNLLMTSVMSMGMVMWLLEDEREKLSKANKDLDSFLYSTSHDLRAPISSILGLTYLGKVELQEERGKEYMGLIEQRVKKLNMIITDILRLSRTKKLDVKFESINFNEVLKETMEDIQFNKGTSSIRLDYTEDPSHIFVSDHNQVSIILSNLISNAVKYHRLNQDDPYIKIGFERNENHIAITVEDNGQGIPPQSVGKIFDMFFRASQETEGTGLGLYIVKEAVTKIKGKINVESVFGKGTKFTVTLNDHAE